MIGGTFNGHPWNAGDKVTIAVHDKTHPASKPWTGGGTRDEFEIQDEIYQFKNWQPEKVRVLMSLNMAKTKLKKPYHVPILWVKNYGDGKAMHMSLGHNESVWANETYRASLLGGIRWVLPSRLQGVETAFAMTVHKSQGSEFGHAALLLPDRMNRVLTRELVYTAVTRASARLTVAGHLDLLEAAIARRLARAGGLLDADA